MDGWPLRTYYNCTSVLLSGLSAYRSPLFQGLRQGGNAIYSFNFFDYPWKTQSFVAFVTVPPVGDVAFTSTIGRRVAEIVAGLSAAELESILFDGAVRKLKNLESMLLSPQGLARLEYLAELNCFSPDPAMVARSITQFAVSDLEAARLELLERFIRHLDETIPEVR